MCNKRGRLLLSCNAGSGGGKEAGKLLAGVGGALVIAGFVLLSFADAQGRNLAAMVSPFLLIGGYAAIGVGLFLPPAPPLPPSA